MVVELVGVGVEILERDIEDASADIGVNELGGQLQAVGERRIGVR